jgi:hypothetical protein
MSVELCLLPEDTTPLAAGLSGCLEVVSAGLSLNLLPLRGGSSQRLPSLLPAGLLPPDPVLPPTPSLPASRLAPFSCLPGCSFPLPS